ncbi:MAG: polyribonucleotide nucleotidyltransferase, partial [Rickettsiales bacterium]|nr:polyribonucleotide nucleotidyltransferase [Rickettsiales bacterium]
MFNIVKKSIEWNGKKIELETGKIARQASASVIVRMGESIVLCTVTFSKNLKEGIDFFPLSVNYLEKYYAAGKFPGGFMKREGKPSDRETLISRLIDRPIRPLFPEDYLYEVNVFCKVLSYDGNFPTDVLAIIGSAAALKISEVPFDS